MTEFCVAFLVAAVSSAVSDWLAGVRQRRAARDRALAVRYARFMGKGVRDA